MSSRPPQLLGKEKFLCKKQKKGFIMDMNKITIGQIRALLTKLGGLKVFKKILQGKLIPRINPDSNEIEFGQRKTVTRPGIRIYELSKQESDNWMFELSKGIPEPFYAERPKKTTFGSAAAKGLKLESTPHLTVWLFLDFLGEKIESVGIFGNESMLQNNIAQSQIKESFLVDLTQTPEGV